MTQFSKQAMHARCVLPNALKNACNIASLHEVFGSDAVVVCQQVCEERDGEAEHG